MNRARVVFASLALLTLAWTVLLGWGGFTFLGWQVYLP